MGNTLQERRDIMLRPTATSVSVYPEHDYTLLVTFDNGEVRLFDVKPYLQGSWYEQLKDYSIFNSVHVAGLSIEWSGGQDICPDDLYYNSIPYEASI